MRLRKKPGFGNFQIRAYYDLLYFNSNGYGFGFSFIFGIAGCLNLNLNLVSALLQALLNSNFTCFGHCNLFIALRLFIPSYSSIW